MEAEYDLKSLRVRGMGAARTQFAGTARETEGFAPNARETEGFATPLSVLLDADVAALFPDKEAVNAALRFVIRLSRENPLAADGRIL